MMESAPPARKSASRDRLLHTAADLFYSEGIRRVGVDRIMAEAPATRATFYRHFPSKESLVVAYLQMADTAIRQSVVERLEHKTAPVDLLRAIAHDIEEEVCEEGFRGCPFINAAIEYPERNSTVHRIVVEHRLWFASTVTTALRDAGHPDPDRAGGVFVMLRDGAMVTGYLSDPESTRSTFIAEVEMILSAASNR